MRILNQIILLKLLAYSALSLCILGGALTYASSVMADQRIPQTPAKAISSTTTPSGVMKVAYSSPTTYPSLSNTDAVSTSPARHGSLLPVLTWFLGSAALAMFGYKRMRHSES